MARSGSHLAAMVVAVLMAGPAAAAEPVSHPPNEFDSVCAAYGPGYHRVPGTDTCLRVGGYVQFDATIGGQVADDAAAVQPLKLPPPKR